MTLPNVTCNFCASTIERTEALRLWDNREYCSSCVNEKCPDLADYRGTHECLEDEFICSGAMFAKGSFKTFAYLFVVLAAFSLLTASRKFVRQMDLGDILILSGLISVVGLIFLVQGIVLLRLECPRVTRVCDGMLQVKSWSFGNRSVPLADCQWHFGNVRQGISRTIEVETFMLKVPALVIRFPGRLGQKNKIALCIDPESRKRWIAFLTLSGVPRTKDKKGFFHFLSSGPTTSNSLD